MIDVWPFSQGLSYWSRINILKQFKNHLANWTQISYEDQWPWDMVCSILDVNPSRFAQIMNLGWPFNGNASSIPNVFHKSFMFL